MNCPSRTEEPKGTGFNQNPRSLSADLTTREDLNGIANARILRRIPSTDIENAPETTPDDDSNRRKDTSSVKEASLTNRMEVGHVGSSRASSRDVFDGNINGGRGNGGNDKKFPFFMKMREVFMTYGKFVGPGFMV